MYAVNQPPQPARNNKAVWWFVAASVVVHAVLIAAWRGEPQSARAQSPVALTVDIKSSTPHPRATDERDVTKLENQQSSKMSSKELQRFVPDQSAHVPQAPRVPSKAVPPKVANPARTAKLKDDVKTSSATPVAEVKSVASENSGKPKTLATRPAQQETRFKSTPVESAVTLTSLQNENPIPASPSPGIVNRENDIKRDEIIQRVSSQLNFLRYYPLLARRQGWEGDVQLAFRVDESGAIKAARIAQSSGFKSLDDNALEALMKIKHLAADRESVFQPEELSLAVRYRLLDG